MALYLLTATTGTASQGCLWGGPPACPICPIDLHACPVRVKWALTDGHSKSDLPCPCWLPPGPPRRHASGRRRVAGSVRDVGRGPCGRQWEGERRREGRTGADADGANGYLGADGSSRYGYVGADVSGRYWYVGANATVDIVRRART
jgi:hypothetical protein